MRSRFEASDLLFSFLICSLCKHFLWITQKYFSLRCKQMMSWGHPPIIHIAQSSVFLRFLQNINWAPITCIWICMPAGQARWQCNQTLLIRGSYFYIPTSNVWHHIQITWAVIWKPKRNFIIRTAEFRADSVYTRYSFSVTSLLLQNYLS